LVNGVLYRVQFRRTLDDRTVDWITRAILERPILRQTRDEQYEMLVTALRSSTQLTGHIPLYFPHDEQDVRDFLARVVCRLDALRPWPELPFLRLDVAQWQTFADARPIARIHLRYVKVQERLHAIFDGVEDGHEVVLLRLKSGAEVALVTPWGGESDDVAVLQRDRRRAPRQVLTEFLSATGFDHDEVTAISDGGDES
jgi:hypothetical protein